ncbi:hypothetical protein SADUNF_Sadunf04G0050600 [Salix dunnii]|uniref:Uncharacterized protein n=1 Tax=Salix dunnii TaxID=1413687 RepID=A0A835KAK7_9ROSI|nr:hypothetical protein SADUNF_Sadunf04G0050600 [Salix dunnii]
MNISKLDHHQELLTDQFSNMTNGITTQCSVSVADLGPVAYYSCDSGYMRRIRLQEKSSSWLDGSIFLAPNRTSFELNILNWQSIFRERTMDTFLRKCSAWLRSYFARNSLHVSTVPLYLLRFLSQTYFYIRDANSCKRIVLNSFKSCRIGDIVRH